MNVYEKFRQVGHGRRAWYAGLAYECTSRRDFKPEDVVVFPGRAQRLGISEILSTSEIHRPGYSLFDLVLADGRKFERYVQAERFKMRCTLRTTFGKVAYSKHEIVEWFDSMLMHGLTTDERAVLDLFLTLKAVG